MVPDQLVAKIHKGADHEGEGRQTRPVARSLATHIVRGEVHRPVYAIHFDATKINRPTSPPTRVPLMRTPRDSAPFPSASATSHARHTGRLSFAIGPPS